MLLPEERLLELPPEYPPEERELLLEERLLELPPEYPPEERELLLPLLR